MTTETNPMIKQAKCETEGHITRKVSANFIERLLEDAELARARTAAKSSVSSQNEEVYHDRTQEEE